VWNLRGILNNAYHRTNIEIVAPPSKPADKSTQAGELKLAADTNTKPASIAPADSSKAPAAVKPAKPISDSSKAPAAVKPAKPI
jgi:hypothetical protein